MNETTRIPHALGACDGDTPHAPSFDGAGIGPIELRVYGEAWREGLRFRRDVSGDGPEHRPRTRSPGFAGLLRMPSEMDDDNTGFEESANREGCPPSAPRIAAALLLARAFDALPAAARDLVSGGAPVVVDVADGAMLDALKGEWRGMFFDAPFRLIDLVRTAPGRRSALDGAYIMLKEPLKGAAKERLERVAADMCGYALPFVAFSPDGRACLPKVVNDAARHRIWCDGCGNYGIWTAVKYALVELHLHPWQVCLCYDVGCHGNGSDKIEGYRFHGLHGRVIPFAAGTKLAFR
jgi:cell division protease FtsH